MPHDVPQWVKDDSVWFITICCDRRQINQLCRPVVKATIQATAEIYLKNQRWFPRLILLMPDHLHLLAAFGPEGEMKKCISDFKRYLARTCGVNWQRDFFDHRLRGDEAYREKASYIRNNPVRQGFCGEPGEWSWILDWAPN